MKILPMYFNSKNATFCGNQCYSTENWIALRNELTKKDESRIDYDAIFKTNTLQAFNKPKFEYSDYESLSPKERLIIQIINRKGVNGECYYTHRKD